MLGSFAASFLLSGFPHTHATTLLAIPAILALTGMLDTVRCVRPRWGFYHGGVILLLLMDTLAVCLILSFLFLPYLF